MAIFHMTAKVCKTSATAKIDYIQRQNKYSYSTKAEDLIFSSEKNIPAWAKNARDFFAEMDKQELSKKEKERSDISSEDRNVKCREIEFALPVELSKEEQIELAEKFCAKIMGDNHAYAFAIHKNKGALSGKENPHVHLVYSDRLIERDRDVPRELFCRQRTGYKKDRTITGPKRHDWYRNVRKTWADMVNEKLKEKNVELISERSYQEQGIERTPQKHLGHDTINSLGRGIENERYKAYKDTLRTRVAEDVEKELNAQIKEIKPTFKDRIKAGVHLALYTYSKDEYRERDKSVLKGETAEIKALKSDLDQSIERAYKNALESQKMNSKASLRRKSYSSKSLITEYRTNFLNSTYDKYKKHRIYPTEERLRSNEKSAGLSYDYKSIKFSFGKITAGGVFVDRNSRCYELAKVAKFEGDKFVVMGVSYRLRPSNLEIAKKSYEISSKVVEKEIDRLEQAYRAERLRKLENIPSLEKKDIKKAIEQTNEIGCRKRVPIEPTKRVPKKKDCSKENNRGGFSR